MELLCSMKFSSVRILLVKAVLEFPAIMLHLTILARGFIAMSSDKRRGRVWVVSGIETKAAGNRMGLEKSNFCGSKCDCIFLHLCLTVNPQKTINCIYLRAMQQPKNHAPELRRTMKLYENEKPLKERIFFP